MKIKVKAVLCKRVRSADEIRRRINKCENFEPSRKLDWILKDRQDLKMSKSGLGHLKPEEQKAIVKCLPFVDAVVLTQDECDQIAAKLFEDFPWMSDACDYIWKSLRKSATEGRPAHFKPVLLNGLPGIGKTAFSRRLSDLIGIGMIQIDASSTAFFALQGLEKGWNSSTPSVLVDHIVGTRSANAVVLIDELCKSSTLKSAKSGESLSVQNALLNITERETASAFHCNYHRVKFDLSHMSFICTSNQIDTISQPLLNRLKLINVGAMTVEQVKSFALKIAAKRGITEDHFDMIETLVTQVAKLTQMTLRDAVRVVDAVESYADRSVFH
jgi:hypothetical protein